MNGHYIYYANVVVEIKFFMIVNLFVTISTSYGLLM